MDGMMTSEQRQKAIEARRRGERPERRGDAVDLVLKQMEIQRQIGDYEQFDDYPEVLLPTLRLYVKHFHIPRRVVPYKEDKKRFNLWTKELDEIRELTEGKLAGKAMKVAGEDLRKIPNWHQYITRPKGNFNKIFELIQSAFIKIESERIEDLKYLPQEDEEQDYITDIDLD